MKRHIIVLCAAASIWRGPHAQTAEAPTIEPTLLEQGKTIERQLAGGHAHEYRFTLNAGQYAQLLPDQRSISVAVPCFGPRWQIAVRSRQSVDRRHRDRRTERRCNGTYRFRVMAAESTASLGRYDITLREILSATEWHRSRIAAARAYSEAQKIVKTPSRAAAIAAIPEFEEALGHWRAAQDTFEEARTLFLTSQY